LSKFFYIRFFENDILIYCVENNVLKLNSGSIELLTKIQNEKRVVFFTLRAVVFFILFFSSKKKKREKFWLSNKVFEPFFKVKIE